MALLLPIGVSVSMVVAILAVAPKSKIFFAMLATKLRLLLPTRPTKLAKPNVLIALSPMLYALCFMLPAYQRNTGPTLFATSSSSPIASRVVIAQNQLLPFALANVSTSASFAFLAAGFMLFPLPTVMLKLTSMLVPVFSSATKSLCAMPTTSILPVVKS